MRGRISRVDPAADGGSLPYRPEIDGLRAVAVAAVVLYHAGAGSAGFVGVDVFFVISGYLITGLLLRELQRTGRVDIASFYARRSRRILPAAILVISTVCLLSSELGPGQFVAVLRSAAASLVFLANFHFQSVTGGYFEASADELPLLHLWSLSVEEQFYLFWPVTLSILGRCGRRGVMVGAGVIGILSFVLAQVWTSVDPEGAFFQMPARLWELAIGALIAASPSRSGANSRWLPAVGLVLLAYGLVAGIPDVPGIGALPAVVGAALIVVHIHRGGTNGLLACRPFVAIGLISYPLYLWHWPLLALNNTISIGPPRVESIVLLCSVALLLSFATYRYVEQPIRKIRTAPYVTTVVSATTLAALALFAWRLADLPGRDDPFPLATSAERDYPDRRCHSMGHEPVVEKCGISKESKWAVWGDSMAYAWSPAVLRVDPKAAVYTRDSCGPYPGLLPASPSKADQACQAFVEMTLGRLETFEGSNVVLAALWTEDESRFKALERALAAISPSARRVIMIGPTPKLRDGVPACLRSGRPEACSISRAEFDVQARRILGRLRRAASPYRNVVVLDVSDEFCTKLRCDAEKDGLPLYWDSHHVAMRKAQSIDLEAPAAASR